MELIKLDSSVPIRQLQEEELNRVLLRDFVVWLSNLLSLSDETSANRLEIALPAIREHCWSMSFSEIKKMFELYADNKLSIEPIPNYFDRILFGKIVDAYKKQKNVVKKPINSNDISEQEKIALINSGMRKCIYNYEKNTDILEGYLTFMYDVLIDDGFIVLTKQEKLDWYDAAKEMLQYELITSKPKSFKERLDFKELRNKIAQKNSNVVVAKAKEMILLEYLRKCYLNEDSVKKLKNKYKNNC